MKNNVIKVINFIITLYECKSFSLNDSLFLYSKFYILKCFLGTFDLIISVERQGDKICKIKACRLNLELCPLSNQGLQK